MLDEKDLQAIADLMDRRIGASESRMMAYMKEEIGASESRMREEIGASESRMREEIGASESRMREEIAASESRTREEIVASESRMREEIGAAESRMLAMMEAYFEPKFNALGDQLKLIQEKLVPMEALEDAEDRIELLEVAVKQHSREIEALKMAQ